MSKETLFLFAIFLTLFERPVTHFFLAFNIFFTDSTNISFFSAGLLRYKRIQ